MKPKPKPLGEVAMETFHGKSQENIKTMFGDDDLYLSDWSRAARAVIREYEKRQWRPVSTPPKLGTLCLIGDRYHVMEFLYDGGFPRATKHWRPMPKGPK